jgi:hypothetical protein
MKPRVLFILRRREDFNASLHAQKSLSTGLFNSANFMVDMLKSENIDTDIQVAVDANSIDSIVSVYKPTHVVIEALWVFPAKFAELTRLHPDVKWIIRLHSEIPFIANEGIAIDWIGDYVTYPNVIIAANTERMQRDLQSYISNKEYKNDIIYLPNYYPQEYKKKSINKSKYWIDVGCFGAVRPLKNQLIQAVAALKFANKINKQLRFHINGNRIENKGDSVFKNIVSLFQQVADSGHTLICHDWAPRDEFLKTCGQMDIGMQVSFSETFNIVAADLVSQGVPVVTSEEIPWTSHWFDGDPNDSESIYKALMRAYHYPNLNVHYNINNLKAYTNKTKKTWVKYFKGK